MEFKDLKGKVIVGISAYQSNIRFSTADGQHVLLNNIDATAMDGNIADICKEPILKATTTKENYCLETASHKLVIKII